MAIKYDHIHDIYIEIVEQWLKMPLSSDPEFIFSVCENGLWIYEYETDYYIFEICIIDNDELHLYDEELSSLITKKDIEYLDISKLSGYDYITIQSKIFHNQFLKK